MTPDTSSYMIAGFVVIFAGMIGYALSLVLRNKQVKRKLEILDDK